MGRVFSSLMPAGMVAAALAPPRSAFGSSFPSNFGASWRAAAEEDDELDVFSAEKYFSGAVDGPEHGSMDNDRWDPSPVKQIAGKTKVGAQIPWSPPPPPLPVRRRFLRALRCCSCSGESCVEIGGRAAERDEPDGGDLFGTKRMPSFLSSASKRGHAETPTGGEEASKKGRKRGIFAFDGGASSEACSESSSELFEISLSLSHSMPKDRDLDLACAYYNPYHP